MPPAGTPYTSSVCQAFAARRRAALHTCSSNKLANTQEIYHPVSVPLTRHPVPGAVLMNTRAPKLALHCELSAAQAQRKPTHTLDAAPRAQS